MRGPDESYLSSPRYGYDFVVSVTEESINATIKQHLASLEAPQVAQCYVDDGGREVGITLKELQDKSGGVNPFDIPHGTDVKDARFENLNNARFLRGWRARLGLAPMTDVFKTKNLVELNANATSVKFDMQCAEFQVVAYIEGGRFGKDKWINVAQKKDHPWIFKSVVDLTSRTLHWNDGGQQLPSDVQDKIKDMQRESGEKVFDIEQLIMDLENAKLAATVPELEGVEKGTPEYTMLQETFLGTYFQKLKEKGDPLLNCTIKRMSEQGPEPTLRLTDFRYGVSPYVDGKGEPVKDPTEDQRVAATLNYLCAADGNKLPPAVPFTWNWVDTSELDNHHGVISISRNSLAGYFAPKLLQIAKPMCFKPKIYMKVTNDTDTDLSTDFSEVDDTATLDLQPTGSKVLSLAWSSKQYYAETWWGLYQRTTQTHYWIDVYFEGTTVTIKQRFVLYFKAKENVWWGEANIADKSRTDVYHLAVNDRGKLEAKTSFTEEDNSKKLDLWLPWFSDYIEQEQSKKLRVKVASLTQLPLNVVQDYVFPGGRAFVFKDVDFSLHQDLISRITYAD
ncbi:hypothetical protein N3K66_007910 [Trichothecium roseum]|uniref:Uncharacterized protein n=1 Tax=Trichothecium roseum TaxID=47278 RepID=A0ACC0USB3_9HYPO|nr:hypothetical protein N3K66_007910 [Trichothecium roseum]